MASVSLPHNLEAEQALLGAMLIDNRLVEDVQINGRSLPLTHDPNPFRTGAARLPLVMFRSRLVEGDNAVSVRLG